VHVAAFFQLLQQHLGVSVNHHQQVVEVVGNAAGEASDSIHFLRLAKLLFELTPVGDVFGDQLQYFFGFIADTGGAATEPHNDDAPVFASPLHFDAVETSAAAVVLGQPVPLLGIQEDFAAGIELEKIFDRSLPKHGDERRIHVEKSSADGATANAEGGAQNQRPGAGFGAPKRFFMAFVLDRRSQLLRNKFQNLAVPLSEAGVLVVALDDQGSHAGGAALQGNAEPVQRRSAEQLHFATPHQVLKHRGCGQQGLGGSQDVFREPATQWLWRGCGIRFIDEVGKTQQLRLRIVKGDIEVARIHQLTDDGVNRREELLQIFGCLAARRDSVQGGIQLLGALLLGDVAIGGVRPNSFAV